MRAASRPVLAVGFFDGVHLGHRRLLENADVAFTFDEHPLAVLHPERAPVLLMTREERLASLRASGVAEVKVAHFDFSLAERSAEEFARSLCDLMGGEAPRVKCGENWRFGRGGKGDAAFLRALGMEVEVVPYAEWKGERISSSRIRQCLSEGRLGEANEMLGRPYEVSGHRVDGKGLGRQIGYPTLNIDPGRRLNLRLGVYAVELACVRGVANYGLAPTMGERAWPHPLLEVHLLDEVPSALSAPVRFRDFLRPERTFASVSDLQHQIAEDCKRAWGAEEEK